MDGMTINHIVSIDHGSCLFFGKDTLDYVKICEEYLNF